MNVVMDVLLVEGEPWKTILPEHAIRASRACPERPRDGGRPDARPLEADEISSLLVDTENEEPME